MIRSGGVMELSLDILESECKGACMVNIPREQGSLKENILKKIREMTCSEE